MTFRPISCVLLMLITMMSACSDPAVTTQTTSVAAPVGSVAAGAASAESAPPIPAPPQVQARGYFLIDFVSGQVLAASNENERLEPASLTKLMSAYAIFHALKDGRIKRGDIIVLEAMGGGFTWGAAVLRY